MLIGKAKRYFSYRWDGNIQLNIRLWDSFEIVGQLVLENFHPRMRAYLIHQIGFYFVYRNTKN